MAGQPPEQPVRAAVDHHQLPVGGAEEALLHRVVEQAHQRAPVAPHVEQPDGSRLDGAAAFVAMWERLPGWRWLARIARLPGMLAVFEFAYRGFLRVRPGMQSIARRWENARGPASRLPGISEFLERELRSDHAGETGAVWIYRGIAAVAARAVTAHVGERGVRGVAGGHDSIHAVESSSAGS